MKVDIEDISKFFILNTLTKTICYDDYFWIKKAEHDFNYSFNKLNNIEGLSGWDKYKTLYQNNFKRAIDDNRVKEVQVLLGNDKIDPNFDDNYALRTSVIKNYVEMIEILLKDFRIDLNLHGVNIIKWASLKSFREWS